MKSKSAIRKENLKLRLSLSSEKEKQAEIDLLKIWTKFQSKNQVKLNKVGVYWSINKELSTLSIINNLLEKQCKCYLPVLSSKKKGIMTFRNYDTQSKMMKNNFGIYEPLDGEHIKIDFLDLIILPLVAFDKLGYRIGMGKGYYDIALKNYNKLTTCLIGVGYDFQELENCFPEGHDILLEAVLTPSRIIKF